ncbi:hypothetical protein [Paenibacillus sp. YYML68]|uniref:hypothetical protein n=1 Tax=Paenibacillus sp. YYML68 TaxID=2909250 RepID=UPI00249260A7|nr:hypothetical protein [Paenibacillus sp. YYML68]
MSTQEMKPMIMSHKRIVFETAVSGGGTFPGLGNGVNGNPAKDQGQFPGGGNTNGQFPGNANPGQQGSKGNGNGNGNGNGKR